MTDRDRLLQIWKSRVQQGLHYASKDELEAAVKAELQTLANDLYANNFIWPAEAIAGFLLDEYDSLDKAFGLKRGKPMSKETLERDVAVLHLYFNGKKYHHISKTTDMDRKDVRGLCENRENYRQRFTAAYAEIIARRIDFSPGPTWQSRKKNPRD